MTRVKLVLCAVAFLSIGCSSDDEPQIKSANRLEVDAAAVSVNQIITYSTIGRDVVTYAGYNAEQVQAIVKPLSQQLGIASEARAKAEAEAARLASQLGYTRELVIGLFGVLGEQEVPLEQLPLRLAEIVARSQELLAQPEAASFARPEVQRLKVQARTAFDAGEFAQTETLLNQAKARDLSAIAQMEAALERMQADIDARKLSAANTAAENGALMMTQLRYADAARYYAEAVGLTPERYEEQRRAYVEAEADALYRQGDERGDDAALNRAIGLYRELLEAWRSKDAADRWAEVQVKLGLSLQLRGWRRDNTADLEEAVEAFRQALEVLSPERDTSAWVMAQIRLSGALQALSSLERDTARIIEEAVDVSRQASKERARVPKTLVWETDHNLATALEALGWRLQELGRKEEAIKYLSEAVKIHRRVLDERISSATLLERAMTHGDLGRTLEALGWLEGDTADLEEAVAVFQDALNELEREDAPRLWGEIQHRLAHVQVTLGSRLQELGRKEEAVKYLKDAVTAYGQALEARTQEQWPLDWAATKSDLGQALYQLGKLEQGTEHLEKAKEALLIAREERTRDGMPTDWAETQRFLGATLWELGNRKQDTELFEEAKLCLQSAQEVYRQVGRHREADGLKESITILEGRHRSP